MLDKELESAAARISLGDWEWPAGRTVSLEYGHMYVGHFPTEVWRLDPVDESLTRRMEEELTRLDISSLRLLLIDDYSEAAAATPPFGDEQIKLADSDLVPHTIIRESALTALMPDFLDMISSSSAKRSVKRWHRKTDKWPCSALIAAWYLFRLGLGPYRNSELCDIHGRCLVSGHASVVVNVLNAVHRESEDRAYDLIAATPWPEAIDRIVTVFYTAEHA